MAAWHGTAEPPPHLCLPGAPHAVPGDHILQRQHFQPHAAQCLAVPWLNQLRGATQLCNRSGATAQAQQGLAATICVAEDATCHMRNTPGAAPPGCRHGVPLLPAASARHRCKHPAAGRVAV